MGDDDQLWTPDDLRAFLRIEAKGTFYKVKRCFPRVPGIEIERYNPAVVRAIVMNRDAPAHKHHSVKAARRRLATSELAPPEADDARAVDHLWTPKDLKAYLNIGADRTFSRVKKCFPRVQGIPIERYDPQVVKAIIAGKQAPAHQHRAVKAAAKRGRE